MLSFSCRFSRIMKGADGFGSGFGRGVMEILLPQFGSKSMISALMAGRRVSVP